LEGQKRGTIEAICRTIRAFLVGQVSIMITPQQHQLIVCLRKAGLTTPEICREVGLDGATVVAILAGGQPSAPSPPQKPPKRASAGRPPRPWPEEELKRLADLLCASAEESGYRGRLWTPRRFVKTARMTLRIRLTKDTLWRQLQKQGLSFEEQWQQVLGQTDFQPLLPKRSKLYLIVETNARRLGLPALSPAVALMGLTPTHRLVAAARQQCRITPKFLCEFLEELLALHPRQTVMAVVEHRTGERDRLLKRLAAQNPKLHLWGFSSKN